MEQPETQESEITTNEVETEVTESEVLDSEVESDESQDEAEEEQYEEIERNGKKYRVPSELKGEFLMQSDYTRKTQEVAEQKRAVEAARQEYEARRTFEAENLDVVADIRGFDRQLQQLSQINLMQLSDHDPVQAQKVQLQIQQLQTIRGQAVNLLAQRESQFKQWEQQQAASRLQEGERVLMREIPEWGPEVQRKIFEFGLSIGKSREYLATVSNPEDVMNLYSRMKVAELKAKATQKTKPTQEKPVTKISASKATAQKDPDRMSVEEWTKWRNESLRKRK